MQTMGVARGHGETGAIVQNGVEVRLLNDLAKFIIEFIAQSAAAFVRVHAAHSDQAIDGGVSLGGVHMAHGHTAQLLEEPHHVFVGQVAKALHLLERRQRQLVPLIIGDFTACIFHQHILQLERLQAGWIAQSPLAVLPIGQLTRLA